MYYELKHWEKESKITNYKINLIIKNLKYYSYTVYIKYDLLYWQNTINSV